LRMKGGQESKLGAPPPPAIPAAIKLK